MPVAAERSEVLETILPVLPRPTECEISDHFEAVRNQLACISGPDVLKIVQLMRSVRDRGSFVYLAGNGGSASTASHWANDLGKATKRSGQRPIKVVSLSDNVSWFSALANDEGYDRSFSGQLENFVSSGDLLVCISASGNSKNLIAATELASARGAQTFALLGFDGGALKRIASSSLVVHCERGAYELVEDVHMSVCHAVTRCLVADKANL